MAVEPNKRTSVERRQYALFPFQRIMSTPSTGSASLQETVDKLASILELADAKSVAAASLHASLKAMKEISEEVSETRFSPVIKTV